MFLKEIVELDQIGVTWKCNFLKQTYEGSRYFEIHPRTWMVP